MTLKPIALSLGLFLAPAFASDSPVLIEDGATRLTLRQFEQALARLPNAEQADIQRSPESLMQFVASLFAEQALIHEAERQGLDQIPRIAAQIEQARQAVLRRAMLEQHRSLLDMPDFDALAEEHYLARPERYTQPARIRIAQIFLRTAPEDREAVRERAEALLAELHEGADFAELAREHSQDPNAARGGELEDWLTEGRLDNPIVHAAFDLREPGEWSEILESEAGLHIIQLLERQPERLQPFSRVQDRIVTELAREYQEQAQRDFINSFYPGEDAHFNRELLRSLLRGSQ